jgi:hypothetical protein
VRPSNRAEGGAGDERSAGPSAPVGPTVDGQGAHGPADEGAAPTDTVKADTLKADTVKADTGTADTGTADTGTPDTATRTLDKPEPGSAATRATRRKMRLPRRAPAWARSAFTPVARGWRKLVPDRRMASGGSGVAAAAMPASTGEAASSALARLTALPAILIVAWLLPGLPLLLGGTFLPVPMLLISVPLAAALTVNGLRDVPARWPRPGSARAKPVRAWTAWFGLLGTVAVVAGLIAWQIHESSESLIVLRDAGTYLQAGYWIAQHGVLPIPQQLAAFGGAHSGLTFASNGFLSRGGSLFPAVAPGMPMLLAAGFWAHGVVGAEAVGPILGGMAALGFAGMAARLVGPQWAPAGALVLGLSLPQQYISRSTLSETAFQVLLFGGLCLLGDALLLRSLARPPKIMPVEPAAPKPAVAEPADAVTVVAGPADAVTAVAGPADAVTAFVGQSGGRSAGQARLRGPALRLRSLGTPADWAAGLTPQRMLAALAGLALSLGLLVSLDGLLYLLPVIPFCALLLIGRRPQGIPFTCGVVAGCVYGVAGIWLLDRPFLDTVGETAAIAGVAAVWLIAVAVVVGQSTRLPAVRRQVPRLLAKIPLRWLPEFGGLLTAAALIGFVVRPYVQTVRGHPTPAVASMIASLQRLQGLPVDPDRLYSEQSLYWVIWYIGLPTVLLGGAGLVALVRNSLRALVTWRDPDSRWRIWALPLAIICTGSLAVLWQPDIAPDQPWASQRLVVVALPGFILAALWAASWLTHRARTGGARAATAVVVGLFCAAAMLVPTAATTFGVGISHGGRTGGLRPIAQGLALQRTGSGQVAAVTALCAQIPRDASVVIITPGTASQFSQVVRGMCGVPVASMSGQRPGPINAVIAAISSAGRRPVLLASSARQLSGFGGSPVRVLDLSTTTDPQELTQLPTAPTKIHYGIWMTIPSGAAVGA